MRMKLYLLLSLPLKWGQDEERCFKGKGVSCLTFALFLRKAERMQGNQDLLTTDAPVAAEGRHIFSGSREVAGVQMKEAITWRSKSKRPPWSSLCALEPHQPRLHA